MTTQQMTENEKVRNRAFTVNCWNGLMDKIERTVTRHPDAVHWRHPENGMTGLSHAVAHGRHKLDVVEYLYDKGADLNARDDSGETALIKAARQGDDTSAGWLLDHGADETILNDAGQDAGDIALAQGREAVVALFARHAARKQQQAREQAAAARVAAGETGAQAVHAGTTGAVPVNKPLRITPKR